MDGELRVYLPEKPGNFGLKSKDWHSAAGLRDSPTYKVVIVIRLVSPYEGRQVPPTVNVPAVSRQKVCHVEKSDQSFIHANQPYE